MLTQPNWRLDMERVSLDLQNCYGIRNLQHNFNFMTRSIYAIYAP